MAGVQSPVPPLQPLQPLRGGALAQSEVQDMSNEKFISGHLWAGCRTRLGVMHQTMVMKKVSWKLRLPFSFTFLTRNALVSTPWRAFLLSDQEHWCHGFDVKCQPWASAQGLGIPRREGTARLASWELKGLGKYSEQRCSKTSHWWNFLLGGEYLEELLNTVSVLFLIIAHSAAPALYF